MNVRDWVLPAGDPGVMAAALASAQIGSHSFETLARLHAHESGKTRAMNLFCRKDSSWRPTIRGGPGSVGRHLWRACVGPAAE